MRHRAVVRPHLLFGAAILILLAVVAAFTAPARTVQRAQAAPGDTRFFDTNCGNANGPTNRKNDDPIRFPGQPGAAHTHDQFGNVGWDAYSTGQSMLDFGGSPPEPTDKSRTECMPVGYPPHEAGGPPFVNHSCAAPLPVGDPHEGSCPAEREGDKAAYWDPALCQYTSDPGATPVMCSTPLKPEPVHVYYFAKQTRQNHDCTPQTSKCVTAFPVGFGQIAGQYRMDNSSPPFGSSHPNPGCDKQTNSTNRDTLCSHEWRCLKGGDDNTTFENIDDNSVRDPTGNDHSGFVCGTYDSNNPTKKAYIRVTLHFAECWDGSLDDLNNDFAANDHLRYAQDKVCPAGFPVLLPEINQQDDFAVLAGIHYYYRLARTRLWNPGSASTISGANKIGESSTTDGNTFQTNATLTPSTNKLYIATVRNSRASNPSVVTLAGGGGLTWVPILTKVNTANSDRVTVFRALKSSGLSSGTLTATYNAGVSQTGHSIVVEEFSGTDTSGTDGSGAILQAIGSSGTGTSGSVALSSFTDATNNVAFGAFSIVANESISGEGGYTRLSDTGHSVPTRRESTEFKIGEDTSVGESWTSSVAWAGIALEVKANAGGSGYWTEYADSTTYAHADFLNAWNSKLQSLIDLCLNNADSSYGTSGDTPGCNVSP